MNVTADRARRSAQRARRFARRIAGALRRALDGDPLAFEDAPIPPAAAARLRGEQLATVARNTPVTMVATCVNALIFALVMRNSPDSPLAWLWAAVICSAALLLYARRKARPPFGRSASPRGVRRAIVYGLTMGVLWAILPGWFFPHANHAQQFTIVCLAIGMIAGGAFTLSPIPAAMIAFVAPIAIASLRGILASGDPAYSIVAALLAVYLAVFYSAVTSRAAATARRCAADTITEDGALRDALTKLPNRAAFGDELTLALARYSRQNEGFALLCFDLDGFKAINDTMGHAAGDEVLVETARRLRDCVREVDIVARLGGDEFAIIAANIRSRRQAAIVAERIVGAFRMPFIVDGQSLQSTVSVGVALAPTDGDTPETLMRNADSALYATKHFGRNGHTFFRDRFGFVSERASLEAEFDRAIAEGELFLVFQPVVDLRSLRLAGFEALLRWRHPARGVLSAAEFIPLLERSGMIEEVGAFAVEQAIAVAASWPSRLKLSVNVSSQQLRKPMFEATLRRAVSECNFDPHRLEIELTDCARLFEGETAAATLDALGALGVTAALDDLGAGVSTIAMLAQLPLGRLKIDRSVVAGVETDPASASMVRISVELGRALDLAVTAKGVERAGQLAALARLGCVEVQGFLFGAPAPASELAALFDADWSHLRGAGSAPGVRLAS